MATPKLHISTTVALPLDFVTSTQAILAKKGSGKSYTASVEAEEMLDAGQQIVAIDPTGSWFGLRSSADGKHAGYPIAILGGEHADVPLEATAGEVIADAIASEHFSAIIDLSLFRKGEALRFMAVFLETLYRKNREAMHLFVDEADVVAPQKTFGPDEARVLGAAEDIVRRGRKRGIGCTLITQRPQVLNKNVLSQVDMLTVLRMNHPKDLKAIDDWVGVHGDPDTAKQLMADLPALPIGEAYLWAPARDLFEHVVIRRRRTFDSGATPKAGERAVAPKQLAAVDIARLGVTIAATVERAKADDPKALKARLAELEKQLAAKPGAKVETKTVEKAVIKDGQLTRIAKLIEQGEAVIKRWDDANANAHEALTAVEGRAKSWFGALDAALGELRDAVRSTIAPAPTNRQIAAAHFASDGKVTKHVGKHQIRVPANPGKPVVVGDTRLDPADLKFLSAVAWWASIGVDTPSLRAVSFIAEASSTSSSFANRRSKLRTLGLIAYPGPDAVALTPEGAELAPPAPPASIDVLQNKIKAALDPADVRMLDVLLDAYPDSVTLDDLADRIGASPTSSSFANRRSALKSLGLAEYPASGHVRASSLLFPEGLS